MRTFLVSSLLLLAWFRNWSTSFSVDFDSLLYEGNRTDGKVGDVIGHLRNKKIVFIGDSVTRYQYLALVFALTHGQFVNVSMRPNFVEERSFPSWIEFYRTTNTMLKPFEFCDCYRAEGDVLMHLKDKYKYNVENRYFVDEQRGLYVYYLDSTGQGVGGGSIHGHWMDEGDNNEYRAPRTSPLDMFWSLPLVNAFPFIQHNLRPFNHPRDRRKMLNVSENNSSLDRVPTIVILNAGHHPHSFRSLEYAKKVHQAMYDAHIDQFIWRETTKKVNAESFHYDHDRMICSLPPVQGTSALGAFVSHPPLAVTCMNTSWTHGVNQSILMWDNLHFRAPVYNLLNFQLMELMINSTDKHETIR